MRVSTREEAAGLLYEYDRVRIEARRLAPGWPRMPLWPEVEAQARQRYLDRVDLLADAGALAPHLSQPQAPETPAADQSEGPSR